MKSFFTFLSRNKTYTFINVLGFSLSLMFVIIIGLYAEQEYGIDKGYSNAARIYTLTTVMEDADGGGIDSVEGCNWGTQRMLRQIPGVQATCGVTHMTQGVTVPGGTVLRAGTAFADSTFFTVLPLPLREGQAATVLNQPSAAVVSEAFARSAFGKGRAVGQTLYFEKDKEHRHPLHVAGVFTSTEGTSLPATDIVVRYEQVGLFNPSLTDGHMSNGTGATLYLLAQPGADLSGKGDVARRIMKDQGFWLFNMPGRKVSTEIHPLADRYFSATEPSDGGGGPNSRRGDRRLVNVLAGVGLVILVFSIINYVNLTVAQASSRAREMATRRLLGAQRTGIMARLMAESFMLCFFSMVLAAVLAAAAMPQAAQLIGTQLNARSLFTPAHLLTAVAFVAAVALLSGMIPAVVISRAKPVEVVRGTFAHHSRMWFSRLFIVFQNTVTIALVACAVTMLTQVHHLVNAPLGYDHDHLIVMPAPDDSASTEAFKSEVRKLACVVDASECCGYPLNGGNNNTKIYGDKTVSFQVFKGDRHYLSILGLKLLRDNRVDDPDGVYVNRQALSEMGLPMDARSIALGDNEVPVRGVLADFKIRDITAQQHPVLLYTADNMGGWAWHVLVKVRGDEAGAYRQVEAVYRRICHEAPADIISGFKPYADQVLRTTFDSTIRMSTIVTLFAAIAVIISMLGLVAMSTYFIQQRRKEVAIRKVFGSTAGQMYVRLLRAFMPYTAVAFVLAVPLIACTMRSWLEQFSYRIGLGVWIYALAGLVCLLVSFLAVTVQSLHAAGESPVAQLRDE